MRFKKLLENLDAGADPRVSPSNSRLRARSLALFALVCVSGTGDVYAQTCSGSTGVTITVVVNDSSIPTGGINFHSYADGNLYGSGPASYGANTLNLHSLVANGSTHW